MDHNEDNEEKVDLVNFREQDLEEPSEMVSNRKVPYGIHGNADFYYKLVNDHHEEHVALRKQLGTSYNFEMRFEAKRLKSFHTYGKCSVWCAQEMASAGLYHTGVNRSVQCFCCGIVFCTNSFINPPKKAHLKYNPSCRFMKGEDVGNSPKYEVRVQPTNQVSLQTYTAAEARLNSFTNWPFYARIQPDQLTAAGFFFTGRRDTVQCFSCGGCLGNWQENDDPWKEHAKWFPNCDFLKSEKTLEEIEGYISSYNGFKGFTGKDFTTSDTDVTSITESSDSITLNMFEDENVRLESFKTWPPNANVEPAELSRWGFFYTGKSDAVKCYVCGICICSFEPGEDPMTEHLKHSTECKFIKRKLEIKYKEMEGSDHTDDKQPMKLQYVLEDDAHRTDNSLDVCNEFWFDGISELRKSLKRVYNNSTFSKLSPFPQSSHISVDLRSLFADIFVVLKDTRNCSLGQITLPDILSELGDTTMIEGEAGSGKTALLRKIAILWASGKCPILNRFSLVFYISVSSIERQQSLCDIICQQLTGSTTSLTETSIRGILRQLENKVLFLLDDYGIVDSSPEVIEELLLKNPWNRLSLAVTVSTDRAWKVRQHAENILAIQDFPLFSSIYIFKQLFSHDIPFLQRFWANLVNSEISQNALKTPLFALALCVFWVQTPNDTKPTDVSLCLNYLKHNFLKHTIDKEKIEVVVLSCGQLALEGIFQARFEFTQENLEEAGVNSCDALRFGLLSMFTSQRLHPIFKFFHPSFQEYLAGMKMNELLQCEDAAKNEIGLSYLQKINTFFKFTGRYYYFLKNSCMHSPKAATMVISHMFSLMNNREAFACQEDTKLHLIHHPDLEMRETLTWVIANNEFFRPMLVYILLHFAIATATESKYLVQCVPVILQFLKGRDITLWTNTEIWLLTFLRQFPEGLTSLKSLEIHIPSAQDNSHVDIFNTDTFKSLWNVPTVEEDYANAYRLTSDTVQNKPDLTCANLKVYDLSKFGFDPDCHRIAVLKIKTLDCTLENDHIPVNVMFFCSLANRIELDLLNSPEFLQRIRPCIDRYKKSIVKLNLKNTEISVEDQELITSMTSLESLQIASMIRPEYIFSNVHHFKALKELEVDCSFGSWDILGILPEEFKSLQKIEKLVFKNNNMVTMSSHLANSIEHFPNLISFTLQSMSCLEFAKIITSLSQNEKLENLSFSQFLNDHELILLASLLPKLKNLKILQIQNTFAVDVETLEIYARALASLENLEEFSFPIGPVAKETASHFIQQLQYMPNLRKLCINHKALDDNSLLELASVTAEGHLRNLEDLDLNMNPDITMSGWRHFFDALNVPQLRHLGIARGFTDQFKTDPVTLIGLIRCVSRHHNLIELVMFGWLLDAKDLELINEMKAKHPNAKSLTLQWQVFLPFPPIISD